MIPEDARRIWADRFLRETEWPVEVVQFHRVGRNKKPVLARRALGRRYYAKVHSLDQLVIWGALTKRELPPLSDGRRRWLYTRRGYEDYADWQI